MLTFEKDLIYTGMSERTSKKTEKKYIIANFLGEDGQTFSAMSDELISKAKFDSIEQLDKVSTILSLSKFNNNLNMKLLSIEKA